MPNLVLGNSASYDGNTNNAAGIASSLGAAYATASNGALTLNRVTFDNTGSTLNVERKGSTDLGPTGGPTISSNTEGPVEITSADAGLFGTSVTINSGVYLWSDSTSSPALKISTSGCSVNNSGYIIGKGGNSGSNAGGNALEISSGITGVSITNNSGAYIAGGGGGGYSSAGGGGAGGGYSGGPWGTRQGGVVGSAGGVGNGGGNSYHGGSGGNYYDAGGGSQSFPVGSGGGRLLPGTGASGGGVCSVGQWGYGGGSGGVNGNAGTRGCNGGTGGGGGWGAAGGSGGAGGKAIEDNGQTYTLTNNGTVYGAT